MGLDGKRRRQDHNSQEPAQPSEARCGAGTDVGKDLPNEQDCKQQIGVVFGGLTLYAQRLSEITNVTKRFYKEWDEQAYQRYMKQFSWSQTSVNELSSGMKVKYMVALALSHNAKLLIFDEPTSGLDPAARDDLWFSSASW